jgi:cephalosporin-C deacetylase-like acetyl esterase
MILSSLQQGIADVRRARDAVASLPLMQDCRIGVQGTSLGGFVVSTVVGLDSGYDRAFILLAGGNLHDVVLRGKKDAAKIRDRLHSIGVQDDQIVELARPVEPLRLAHRISAEQTWLYNGAFDDVVPRASSYALAKAARLPDSHHIELPANHYTGIIFLPAVIGQIHQAMTEPGEP